MSHPFRTFLHQLLDYHDGGQTMAERVLMPLAVVFGLVGTVGFGYFYYTERAFK
jgi:hypothetical protein